MRCTLSRAPLRLLVLFLVWGWLPSLRAQTVNRSPCEADTTHPDWRVYTNHEFRFCLRYPPTYREVPAPPPDEFSSTRGSLDSLELKSLPLGTYGGPVDNKAGIGFVYIPKSFSVRQMETCCAPTGLDDTPPTTLSVNHHVFYFYGPGGGGVNYADQYLMEMNGKILSIQFGGPWKDSKSPIEEMKSLEAKILSTLQTY
jgi:hypothetical protein